MNTVFIYALKDPRDGRVRYVGKTKNLHNRLARHLNLRAERETHKTRWICHLVRLGLRPKLEVLDEVPETKWEFFERAYIKVYREAGVDLTNTSDGGDCGPDPTGTKQSEETKEKRRKTLRGMTRSEETRERLRVANSGERNPQFGKRHSEEHRVRRSEWMTGKKRGPYKKKEAHVLQ